MEVEELDTCILCGCVYGGVRCAVCVVPGIYHWSLEGLEHAVTAVGYDNTNLVSWMLP